jgi:hypothetical protein
MLRGSLPLEGDWSEVWLKIDKVIDQLHIKNHKVSKSILSKRLNNIVFIPWYLHYQKVIFDVVTTQGPAWPFNLEYTNGSIPIVFNFSKNFLSQFNI